MPCLAAATLRCIRYGGPLQACRGCRKKNQAASPNTTARAAAAFPASPIRGAVESPGHAPGIAPVGPKTAAGARLASHRPGLAKRRRCGTSLDKTSAWMDQSQPMPGLGLHNGRICRFGLDRPVVPLDRTGQSISTELHTAIPWSQGVVVWDWTVLRTTHILAYFGHASWLLLGELPLSADTTQSGLAATDSRSRQKKPGQGQRSEPRTKNK